MPTKWRSKKKAEILSFHKLGLSPASIHKRVSGYTRKGIRGVIKEAGFSPHHHTIPAWKLLSMKQQEEETSEEN